MKLRILSYNIHKGIGGVDRRYRPERISETIRHYDPDVVLLQEVDDGVPRSRRHRQVDLLGDQLNFHYRAFQSNVQLREGCYGNAILSRHPFDDRHDVDLTIPFKKRRRALAVRVHLHGRRHTRSLLVTNLHLGLAGFERVMQLRRLLDQHFVRWARRSTPMVIGGDFNDVWGSLGTRLLEPLGFQAAFGAVNTFPAAYPVRALDRVFFRGELSLAGGFGGHTNMARLASDHLPVMADFEVPGV